MTQQNGGERVGLALGHHDRHMAFVDGTLPDFSVSFVGQTIREAAGEARHERMLLQREFEAAEVSLASYLLMTSRGANGLTALPIFPRRLFWQSLVFVRDDGPTCIEELSGARIGINSFQTTLSVQLRGDLERVYDVPWRSITWVTNVEEPIAVPGGSGAYVMARDLGGDIFSLLLDGGVDAVVHPHPPAEVLHSQSARRLLADPRAVEERYLDHQGYWPIMHLLAVRRELLDARPGVRQDIEAAFAMGLQEAIRHHHDPNWSVDPWSHLHALAVTDARPLTELWRNGIPANTANLRNFIDDAMEQGVIHRKPSFEELFYEA